MTSSESGPVTAVPGSSASITTADGAQCAPRPLAESIIDHAAIVRNMARLRATHNAKFMAVVKAGAFGHGAVETARTALAAGAEWLGVATLDEALELRRADIVAPILTWLIDPWCDLGAGIAAGITLSCANVETLEAVIAAAVRTGASAEVQLELDTGMARAGATGALWAELCAAAAAAERSGALRVTGLWSHFALASDPGPEGIRSAVAAFEHGLGVAREAGLDPAEVHLANSAATLAHPETALTMVRCGASLYGIETVTGQTHGLEPALRLVTRVTQLRRIRAGAGVGYDHRFVTPRDTTIVLLPVGYADGVPRLLGGLAEVMIGGKRYPMVGVVSMDQVTVDVGDADVELGDEVILLGDASRGEPDAAEWARLASTLSHEILTGLGGRISRRHVNVL
ncbi:alanine racemase [Parafrigoribacterium soli]|uniref:alanine racemase n=1 Tax=Parafrigoribacterium soli TaxID=3144663 RepID=UPI0032EFB937